MAASLVSAPTDRRIASLSLRTTAFTDAKRSKARPGALEPCRRTGASRRAAGRAAAADTQGAIKDKHGDWVTRCETPPGAAHEQCAIVLSVVDQERPNLILVVIVLNTADRKARLMRVIAPLGVLLPPGVSLRIDDADAGRLSFLQCLPNGCVAQLAMDDTLHRQAEEWKDRDARHLSDARAGRRRAGAARRFQGGLRAIALKASSGVSTAPSFKRIPAAQLRSLTQ